MTSLTPAFCIWPSYSCLPGPSNLQVSHNISHQEIMTNLARILQVASDRHPSQCEQAQDRIYRSHDWSKSWWCNIEEPQFPSLPPPLFLPLCWLPSKQAPSVAKLVTVTVSSEFTAMHSKMAQYMLLHSTAWEWKSRQDLCPIFCHIFSLTQPLWLEEYRH